MWVDTVCRFEAQLAAARTAAEALHGDNGVLRHRAAAAEGAAAATRRETLAVGAQRDELHKVQVSSPPPPPPPHYHHQHHHHVHGFANVVSNMSQWMHSCCEQQTSVHLISISVRSSPSKRLKPGLVHYKCKSPHG